jgi:hypothetical protein
MAGLLTALVILLLVGFVLLLEIPAKIDARERLDAFMAEGPSPGIWQLTELDGTSWHVIDEHPEDASCLLIAETDEKGIPGRVEVRKRRQLARKFVRGDLDLFLRNYEITEETIVDEDDPDAAFLAVWKPKNDQGGETSRSVWIDPKTGQIVRIEDHSYVGNCIRCLTRLHEEGKPLEAPALGEPDDGCGDPPERGYASAGRLAADVPFTVYEATYLPPGFELVAANHHVLTVPACLEPSGTLRDPRKIRIAYLLYSDGLCTMDIGTAFPDDLDLLEAAIASQPASDDPEACPPIPERVKPVRLDGELIRRRRDRCRTVLRLDGRSEVSVQLMAQNEIPEDEYLRVLAGVAPVQPLD